MKGNIKNSGVNQCKLQKGNRFKTAWIPSQFAIQGRWLKLLDDDNWQVRSVGTWLPSIAQHHGYFAGGIFHK